MSVDAELCEFAGDDGDVGECGEGDEISGAVRFGDVLSFERRKR